MGQLGARMPRAPTQKMRDQQCQESTLLKQPFDKEDDAATASINDSPQRQS